MVLERDCLQRMERLALPRGFVLSLRLAANGHTSKVVSSSNMFCTARLAVCLHSVMV